MKDNPRRGANQHLRQSLVFLNMPPLQAPEAYIGGADKLFDESGKLTNSSTRDFLGKYVQAFAAWVDPLKRGPMLSARCATCR